MIPASGLTLAALAAVAPASQPGAIGAVSRLGEAVADQVATHADPRLASVGVFVTASAPELANSVQTTLIAKLVARHYKTVIPISAADAAVAESRAREAGLEFVIRLHVMVQGNDLTAGGDLVPTWQNFWAGQMARVPGGTALAARFAADPEALTLARLQVPKSPRAEPFPLRVSVRLVGRIPQRIVAMATGDLDGDGKSELVLLSPDSVIAARADGTVLARFDLNRVPLAARPPRHFAGSITVQRTSSGSIINYWAFDRARGETLTFDGRGLRSLGETDTVPVCAGSGGVLVGGVVAGKGLIEHVAHANSPGHFLPEPVVAVAASLRPASNASFLAMLPDGSGQLLGTDLTPLGAAIPSVGVGSVLADLDGDGQAELIATIGAPTTDDHIRAFRIGHGTLTPLEVGGDAVAGEVLAGATGDFDATGREVAVLAAVSIEGTTLYRVGGEP